MSLLIQMRRAASLLVVAAVLSAACGDETGTGTQTPTNRTQVGDAEAVALGEALAQIRGHHRAALEAYKADDVPTALTHAQHPIDEIMTSLRGELGDRADPLQKLLDQTVAAIKDGAPVARVEGLTERTRTATVTALRDSVGAPAGDPAYLGSVVAALLTTAGHEYEEAVGKSGIENEPEYQDGYAFVAEAWAMYQGLADGIEANAPEEAAEIEEAFEALTTAMPSLTPPANLASESDVEHAAALIGHELEETVGAELATESDPEEIAEEINHLLDEVVESYEAGNADLAAELSAEAYLENYEVIEADVIDQAPDINEELEPLLGAELRRQISSGAPVEDIQAIVDRAKELLGQAVEALEGHGS